MFWVAFNVERASSKAELRIPKPEAPFWFAVTVESVTFILDPSPILRPSLTLLCTVNVLLLPIEADAVPVTLKSESPLRFVVTMLPNLSV